MCAFSLRELLGHEDGIEWEGENTEILAAKKCRN